MARLDTHLDACRLSSEILLRLRKIVREVLRQEYGEGWDRDGIPAELREYLAQRQARELSINWNLSDSNDLLDYAGFANIHDVIIATPNLLQRFLPLAPEAHVLRIRFLELDTILNRIAYARPVSDADLGFLASFDERFKRSTTAAPPAEANTPPAPKPEPEPKPTPPPPPAATPQPSPPPEPEAASAPSPAPVVSAAPAKPTDRLAPNAASPPIAVAAVTSAELDSALRRGDGKLILTALYHDVTAMADGLWNGTISGLSLRAWEHVRESSWYHENFVKLGLKPISDFFGLCDTAQELIRSGGSHADLQEYLKEHSFVQVLLALKELFRQHIRP